MPQRDSTSPRTSVAGQARSLLGLGLPLVGSHLAQMAIVTTDTIMIGWYDVTALAALAVSGATWFIIFILGSGFGWAVMPMVASALASGDERQVRRATRMGLWLSTLYALLVTPAFFFFEPIFLFMGQDPEVAKLGGQYMVFLGLSMLPALLVAVMRSYLSALELPHIILGVTIFASVFNALLNYALIFGNLGAPELGIRGAGLASLIGSILGIALLAFFAARARPEHELFRNFHKPDWEFFAKVFKLGWPIGLTNFAETGLFAASTYMMGWIGPVAQAAHGAALQIASLTFMMHLGLSQAITVRASRAWKNNDQVQLKAACQAAMILSLIAATVTVAVFLLIPNQLMGLFVDPSDPDYPAILTIGTTLLVLAALFQLVDAGQVMALGMLRGVQDTFAPMVIAIVSYWVIGLSVSYVLGFTFGLEGAGIWLGLTVGLACACVLLHLRFWRRYTRPIKHQI